MKTRILLLLFVLLACLPALGQNCSITLTNYQEYPIDFLLKNGHETKFTSSKGKITIGNISLYRMKVFKMEFQNQDLYRVYENTIHKVKPPQWDEEQITFASIDLEKLCLNPFNKYYTVLKPLPMAPPPADTNQINPDKN